MTKVKNTIDPRDIPVFEVIKSMPLEKRLKVSVNDVPFSTRVTNCFHYDDLKTLGDLVKLSEAQLLRKKNFGRDSLSQVKAYLAALDLVLGMSPDLMVAMHEALSPKKEEPPKEAQKPQQLSFPAIWYHTSPEWNLKPAVTTPGVSVTFSESSRERETLQSILDDLKRMTAKIEEVLS